MTEAEREAAIRLKANKMLRNLHNTQGDIAGSAIATVVGRFLVNICPNEEDALGGFQALSGDIVAFIKMAYSHKGTPQ